MKNRIKTLAFLLLAALLLAACATTDTEEAVVAEETAIEEAVVVEEAAAEEAVVVEEAIEVATVEEEAVDNSFVLTTGTYYLKLAEQDYLTVECYELEHVPYAQNIVDPTLQVMNIWIPKEYVNEDGTINWEAEVNGYTAATAPIIFRNNYSGWFSSDPDNAGENIVGHDNFMNNGYIFVACGGRSRNANNGAPEGEHLSWGKSPSQVVDLKAGIRFLRANNDVLPGDTDRIISIGGSGAGEMSSLLSATGNMADYYPYLYAIGAEGIDLVDGEYVSTINDDVFACMAYYPITDIDNADLAYAWMRVYSGETGVHTNDPFPTHADFTPFQLALQEDEAYAFIEYLNGLNLKDADGNDLRLDGLRSGTYYDAILNNMTAALNAYVKELTAEEEEAYVGLLLATNEEDDPWLIKVGESTYEIIDLDGFIHNFGDYGNPDTIGQVFGRNKNVPGFDTLALDAENNAFGYNDQVAVHYSATVGKVLADNYEKYLPLMTEEEKASVDLWIEQTLEGELAEFLEYQTYLMDTMEILYDYKDGKVEMDPCQYWRIRSGTADQHTSFTIGYNLALSLIANGFDTDYHLVWAMIHGGEVEGTSTGTFIDWAESILR